MHVHNDMKTQQLFNVSHIMYYAVFKALHSQKGDKRMNVRHKLLLKATL